MAGELSADHTFAPARIPRTLPRRQLQPRPAPQREVIQAPKLKLAPRTMGKGPSPTRLQLGDAHARRTSTQARHRSHSPRPLRRSAPASPASSMETTPEAVTPQQSMTPPRSARGLGSGRSSLGKRAAADAQAWAEKLQARRIAATAARQARQLGEVTNEHTFQPTLMPRHSGASAFRPSLEQLISPRICLERSLLSRSA